jgi:hypothetical protein
MLAGKSTHHKLVVFTPVDAVEKVSTAMFDAGAGRIGHYTRCSFRSAGDGTFHGDPGTKPVLGKPRRLETVAEIRIETVLPLAMIEPVLAAIRLTHPYEEPAYDLVQLAPKPSGLGMGRIGSLAVPLPANALFERIKRELAIDHLLIAGPQDRTVKRTAVCAGACGNLLDEAIAQNADLFLTGEMRHHDAIKAARAGVTVVCTFHSNSERAVLVRLRDRLSQALPELSIHISKADRDPFGVV